MDMCSSDVDCCGGLVCRGGTFCDRSFELRGRAKDAAAEQRYRFEDDLNLRIRGNARLLKGSGSPASSNNSNNENDHQLATV